MRLRSTTLILIIQLVYSALGSVSAFFMLAVFLEDERLFRFGERDTAESITLGQKLWPFPESTTSTPVRLPPVAEGGPSATCEGGGWLRPHWVKVSGVSCVPFAVCRSCRLLSA